jgi:hypothetical protein
MLADMTLSAPHERDALARTFTLWKGSHYPAYPLRKLASMTACGDGVLERVK